MASTQQSAPVSGDVVLAATDLQPFLARLFSCTGLSEHAGLAMARALVVADLEGVSSHGVTHAPVYLKRLDQGTITLAETPETVSDRAAIAVLDAHSMLGHLAADHAMALAVAKARSVGAGVVSMRNTGHFGVAGHYAEAAAREGCVGIVLGNATPLIAAPGGAERLVGTNPLAIALPTSDPAPLVLDMAMSEVAFGRIRVALREGRAIPDNWALAPDGSPTTDPAQALAGFLLPMAGHKGFGLALMIDLLCGLLADGPVGPDIPRLYEDMDRPFDCSALFIAIDVAAFRDLDSFKADAAAHARRIRNSRTAPGGSAIGVPGDGRAARRSASGGMVRVAPTVIETLRAFARERGLPDLPGPQGRGG